MASKAVITFASAATAAWLALALAGPASAQPAKALVPVPTALMSLMTAKDMAPEAPILIRSFKKESELEIWKQNRAGRYVLLKTFPICRWSGQLGPKRKTGDRQSPEGFYAVAARQMNPNSAYHLSFDLGYPNAYDRAHGGTGSYLMTHGTCSSMGCYAMTDAQISEIYALARDALEAGQRAFQFQAYPFRMTPQNMARARTEKHIEFWRQLKEGYDRFEATGEELAVGVAGGRYAFGPSRNGARESAAQARIAEEKGKIEKLIADGAAAIRTTYSDGGMHASFASLNNRGVYIGQVSRPESLALAGKEIVDIPAKKKPAPTAVASITPAPAPQKNEAATPAAPMAVMPPGTPTSHVGALFARTAFPTVPLATTTPLLAGSAAIVPATMQFRPTGKLALRD